MSQFEKMRCIILWPSPRALWTTSNIGIIMALFGDSKPQTVVTVDRACTGSGDAYLDLISSAYQGRAPWAFVSIWVRLPLGARLNGRERVTRARPSLGLVVDITCCRHTAPAERRDWRGLQARGENPQTWYDEKGERNGPPRKYFVQSREERYHTNGPFFV